MKKNFIILTIIVYVLCCSYILFSLNGTDSVYTNNDIYGKVIVNNCYLKKTPTQINDTSNLYFLLEESYFVKVIAEENDFYYVQYLDLTGYIEKSAINLVNETIQNPYLLNVTFDIIKSTNLFSEAQNNESFILEKLEPQTKVLYYGKIYAEEIYKNSGNVWYYCKIENNNKLIAGYIHSSFTNNLSPILQNNEITSNYVSKNNIITLLNLNLSTQTIIILVISLPVIILSFILLKGFKKY